MGTWVLTERQEYAESLEDFFDFIIVCQSTSYVLSVLAYYSRQKGLPSALVRIGTFGSMTIRPGEKVVVEKAVNDTLSKKYFVGNLLVSADEKIVHWFVERGYLPITVKTLDFFGTGKAENVDMETSAVYSFAISKKIPRYISLGVVSDKMGKNILPLEERIKKIESVGKDVVEWLEQSM